MARLTVKWDDLGLYKRVGREGRTLLGVFALRCSLCRRLTWGCRDCWFCGLCEPCRARVEDAP